MTTNRKPTAATVGFKQLSISAADYTPDQVAEAGHRLRDVITATGLPAFQGVAILAAAESLARASTLAVSALPTPAPAPAGDASEGCVP